MQANVMAHVILTEHLSEKMTARRVGELLGLGTTQTEAGVPSSPRHATSRQLDATSRDVAKSGHPSARPTGTRVENGHPSFRRAPELKTGTRVQPGPRQQARQGAGELPLLSSVEARAPGEIWGAQRGYHPVHTWPATETQNKGAFQGE